MHAIRNMDKYKHTIQFYSDTEFKNNTQNFLQASFLFISGNGRD